MEMTRLEKVWFYGVMAGLLATAGYPSLIVSTGFAFIMLILAIPLGILRWKKATKERQEVEAKHQA
ncbi:hypothetical protein B1R32_108167 [Abditibacterium utsteinense]|uniref:Uncharacterized protein n=2 Tax=Abditibacterium utsteinense TaxID=1960156 RepID=A0A2S8ST52_9BACT|nr:hypothetical protein B1R32_108167 [Abditibacterium utsteinense]